MAGRRALLLVRNTFTHDARVLRAAHVLADLGYEPLVVAVMSTEVRTEHETCEGIPVVRLDPQSPLSVLRRLLRRRDETPAGAASAPTSSAGSRPRLAVRVHRWMRTLDFYRRALGVVRRERPVLLHCNDYNTLWVGALSRLAGRPRVVYDAHELWPDRNGRPEPRWWLLLCEALLLRSADAAITASPGYAEVMARRYRTAPPAVVLNVPDASPPEHPAVPDLGLAVYAGGLLRRRGLETAIDALARVPGLRLRLIGPGAPGYVDELRRRAERAGVAGRVEILPPVPSSEVTAVVEPAAFGIALFEPTCLSHELVAPNKLFEYVVAGVPVLASDLPVLRSFVEEHDVGKLVAPGDVAAVAEAMRALADATENLGYRSRARDAADELTWVSQRRELERAYDRALAHA